MVDKFFLVVKVLGVMVRDNLRGIFLLSILYFNRGGYNFFR